MKWLANITTYAKKSVNFTVDHTLLSSHYLWRFYH